MISTDCRWGLYAIVDAQAAQRDHLEVARAVIAGGARVIQLRDKSTVFEDLLPVAHEMRRLTREAGVTFLVNDNPYLAREVDADGVHIGQLDFPATIAREVVGPDKIVGLSTHTRQQAMDARRLPIDYIGVGPVYPTLTKVSEWPAVGTAMIEWVKAVLPTIPVVAIGGINEARISEVMAAGAENVAIIRDLIGAEDIAERARLLREAVERGPRPPAP